MQLILTRQEIRAQVRAHLGETVTEASGGQAARQYNAFIDAAALKVAADCPWVSNELRVTVDLGAEQYKIAYPANAAVGSIRELALYDTDSLEYTLLEQRDLGLAYDFDQVAAAGGANFDAIQDEPQCWNQRGDFIYLYPPNDDTARKIRLRYLQRLTFTSDSQQSTVDAQALIYWACSMALNMNKETEQRDHYIALYRDRVSEMRGWQNSGQTVPIDSDARLIDPVDQFAPRPNWDTSPRT